MANDFFIPPDAVARMKMLSANRLPAERSTASETDDEGLGERSVLASGDAKPAPSPAPTKPAAPPDRDG